MATMDVGQAITLPASGNLSASQFRFVNVNGSGQAVVVSSAGGEAVGVLITKPTAAGEAANVVVNGIAKVVAGSGGVTAGQKLQSDASGGAINAASLDHVIGTALTTAAAGALVEVLLGSRHILA